MAVFTALAICFVILPLAGYGVNIGMQRVARRDAQAIADAAAQDAARALGTGTTSQSALQTIAQTTASKTPGYTGGSTPSVTLYLGKLSTTKKVADQALGCGDTHFNDYFTAATGETVPDAVLVVVRNSVNFPFWGGHGPVCRSAIGQAFKSACMTMDSYAAQLKTGNSSVLGPLLGILGSNIDASVLSSSGLLGADLDVLSFLNILKTQLGVGSLDEVLNANITATQLIAAEAAALNQQGTTAAAAVSALNSQIGAHVGNLLGGIRVGDLLGITQGGASALGTSINAFDLAAAGVQLANGTNAIALSTTLPPGLIGSTTVTATIGSRPMKVCLGDGTKKQGQTSVSVSAQLNTGTSAILNIVNSLVSGLQNIVGGVLCLLSCEQNVVSVSDVTLTAKASLAQASGKVTGLTCAGATPTSIQVLEQASLAPAKIGVSITLKNVYTKRTLLGILVEGPKTTYTTFTLNLATADPDDPTKTDSLAVPGDYDKGKPGPSGDLSVGSLTIESQTQGADAGNIVAGLLGGTSALVTNLMNLLITPILGTVVTPLLNALTTTLQNAVGLTIAGSTFTPNRTPSCGTPALKG